MKTQLIKEQSQHLINLGVPKEKASAYAYVDSHQYKGGIELPPVQVPIFTLTDFLEILPKEIEDIETDWWLEFLMGYSAPQHKWIVGYHAISDKDRGVQFTRNSTELIDALYELCVWCLESKFFSI